MMRAAHRISVVIVAGYATYVSLLARSGSAGEVVYKDHYSSTNHWMSDIAYIRHPCHFSTPCQHRKPKIFSCPLRQGRTRSTVQLLAQTAANDEDSDTERRNSATNYQTKWNLSTRNDDPLHHWCRRQLLLSSAMMLTSTITLSLSQSALARGLVLFPCVKPLANSYHFMRVGVTLLEEQGMYSTNPLFLTNRDDALSPAGIEQVVETCRQIQLDEKRLPTVVKYSLAASCIDTAMIVGQELKLGTDRIIPEFTFLDPRGIGDWDMSSREVTMAALWAMDNDEAGTDGLYSRPPSSDDGTPHEVLADQAVRLRQILSILESQYSGDTILLIFPDGTGPALLSAMIAGIPYNCVHELEYRPGEIRFDVTMESTLALWKEKQLLEGEAYNKMLEKGRIALKDLRAMHDSGGTVTNLKDQRIEEERIGIEREYRKKQQQRMEAELQKEELRLKLQDDAVQKRRSTGKLDIGTETALGLAAIVGAGTAAWYFSANDTRIVPTNNATESTKSDLESHNFSDSNGSLYATISVNPSETSREGSLDEREINRPTIITVFDPKEKARIAMEEYMERDDGANDWLLSITQIVNEENSMDETRSTGTESVDSDTHT